MTEKNIIKLILLHLAIGIGIAYVPFLAKIYAALIVIGGSWLVIKNRNRNHEILYVLAYIIGSEVFLRSTSGSFCYEYGKYSLVLFTFLGLFFSGMAERKNPYLIYLLLIIPGILIPFDLSTSGFRERIAFDILGPISLGVFALYTYKRQLSEKQLKDILSIFLLPIIANCVYLLICFSYYDGVVTNIESNAFLSGGFAPNQMATLLGLGVFLFFLRILLIPSSKKLLAIGLILYSYVYYRSILTFSRGGILTGLCLIAVLLFCIYINRKHYHGLKFRLALLLIILPTVFALASLETKGHLFRRYINENINGLPKSKETHGREKLAMEEIRLFEENPVTGIGVGKVKEVRQEKEGVRMLSHSELTRLLAEHGILGLFSILILISIPIWIYLKNTKNIYLLPLFAFWLLTINHSGMRVAAPAFIYALALLNVNGKSEEGISNSV